MNCSEAWLPSRRRIRSHSERLLDWSRANFTTSFNQRLWDSLWDRVYTRLEDEGPALIQRQVRESYE